MQHVKKHSFLLSFEFSRHSNTDSFTSETFIQQDYFHSITSLLLYTVYELQGHEDAKLRASDDSWSDFSSMPFLMFSAAEYHHLDAELRHHSFELRCQALELRHQSLELRHSESFKSRHQSFELRQQSHIRLQSHSTSSRSIQISLQVTRATSPAFKSLSYVLPHCTWFTSSLHQLRKLKKGKSFYPIGNFIRYTVTQWVATESMGCNSWSAAADVQVHLPWLHL